MLDIGLGVIAICSGAAFLGGFIDSIAGGGGLITMPALLLCGVPPHQALAANKVSACVGTATALSNFMRSGLVLWRTALTGLGFSLAGAWAGSFLTLHISSELLAKILVILLPLAMLATLFPPRARKDPGAVSPDAAERRLWLAVPLLCLLIGIYDGFFGPGTGSFLILAFHWILGMGLIQASATSKVLNLASNVGGSVTFIWHGKVLWPLTLSMMAACVLGNWLGSRLAIRRGAGAVRVFLFVSLSLLMLTLIWEHFCV